MTLQVDFDTSRIIWYYAIVFLCWNYTQNNSQKVINQKLLKFIMIFLIHSMKMVVDLIFIEWFIAESYPALFNLW